MVANRREVLVAEYLRSISSAERLAEDLPNELAAESMMESFSPGAPAQEAVFDSLRKVESHQPLSIDEAGLLEAIILPKERPVVLVQRSTFSISDPLWAHLGQGQCRRWLEAAIPAIGRIELPSNPAIPFGGTGFVIGPNLLMTNRHVAELFAQGLGIRRVRFKPGETAAVDFRREQGTDDSLLLSIDKVLMIHPYWDMAVLQVQGLSDAIRPLVLSTRAPEELEGREVAVIGYPAKDWRNDSAVQDQVFGGVYNVKRLQPGKVRETKPCASYGNTLQAMTHDCSTLGGNSGSALIDVSCGEVLGLHFAGSYLKDNYAVPAYQLARDSRVVDLGVQFSGRVAATNDWVPSWRMAEGEELAGSAGTSDADEDNDTDDTGNGGPSPLGPADTGTTSVTIPLQLTVSLHAPGSLNALGSPNATGSPGSPVAQLTALSQGSPPMEVEKVPLIAPNLDTREGYQAQFLGLRAGLEVPLPRLTTKGLAAAAKLDDGSPHLHYHRFSLVMHKQRRLALFTAANVDWRPSQRLIDGKKPTRRVLNGFERNASESWVTDPRIPESHQLPDYFYVKDGQAFDRGHLVRRDDVAWGTSLQTMRQGNGDSFHMTNCSPQIAKFNQAKFKGFNWGELENMIERQTTTERVCVFSGPVLDPQDAYFHGLIKRGEEISVQIPTRYWKIIVANQDGRPAAFGFILDQDLADVDLHTEMAIPDAWKRYLRPISEIERLLRGLVSLKAFQAWDQYAIELGGGEPRDMEYVTEATEQIELEVAFEASATGDSSTEASRQPPVYPVWFGTNRKPHPDGKSFGNERASEITRGRVLVQIPKSHRFGEIGSSWWTRLKRWEFTDDTLRIQDVELATRDTFLSQLQAEMQAASDAGDQPHALLFLHGFNVSFEDAAIRAAQIGFDLKVTGATAFFSWPSRGSTAAYTVDEATIEGSEAAITEFVIDFAKNCGAKKVHLIAHSMGNRGLLRAIQRIAARVEDREAVRFGQIILAAPDVDRDIFLDLARLYPGFADQTTLYASRRDYAVLASSLVHAAPRAGFFSPYTVVSGIDTVAVPYFNVDLLGHSEFAAAEALLHDMHDLTRNNTRPQHRQRIHSATAEGVKFWELAR